MNVKDFIYVLDQIGLVCGGYLVLVGLYALYYDLFGGDKK